MWELTFLHGYALSELENLPVFELEIYLDLIAEYQKKQQEAAELAASGG